MKSWVMRLMARKRKGTAAMEFALVATPCITLLFGVTVLGIQLGRNVQIAHVTRDANSMFVRGVDFSKDFNKDLLVRLAEGLNITRAGGDGVVYLSKVTWLPAASCAGIAGCIGDRHVIVQRLSVGNTGLRASNLGTPGATDSLGNVLNYNTQSSATASFPYMNLAAGEFAYVAEGYILNNGLNFPGFAQSPGVYSLAIF